MPGFSRTAPFQVGTISVNSTFVAGSWWRGEEEGKMVARMLACSSAAVGEGPSCEERGVRSGLMGEEGEERACWRGLM